MVYGFMSAPESSGLLWLKPLVKPNQSINWEYKTLEKRWTVKKRILLHSPTKFTYQMAMKRNNHLIPHFVLTACLHTNPPSCPQQAKSHILPWNNSTTQENPQRKKTSIEKQLTIPLAAADDIYFLELENILELSCGERGVRMTLQITSIQSRWSTWNTQ